MAHFLILFNSIVLQLCNNIYFCFKVIFMNRIITKSFLLISLLSFSIASNAQRWNTNKPTNSSESQKDQNVVSNGTTTSPDGYPNSVVNLGTGFGTTYGGLGAKAIIGYRNSGLLVGLGSIFGQGLGYSIGGQISAKWWYASISYGTYLAASRTQFGNGPAEVSIPVGAHFMTGAMINLGKPKRCFLDLGIGLSLGGTIKQYTFSFYSTRVSEVPIVGIAINIGFGVRIGSISK